MAVKGIELASAYVSLSVETSQVPKQVQNALSGIDKYGASAGRDIGRRMGSELSRTMASVGRDAGGEFTDSFTAELTGEGRRAATRFTGDLESQSDRSGRTAGKRFSDSFNRSADAKVDLDASATGRDAGSDAGGSFMSGFGGAIAGLGARGGPIATAIVAGGLAGIKLLGPQISEAMNQALGRDLVQARLGVDPASMVQIDRAARDAFMNNWGSSIMGNMDTAVAAIQSGLITATSSDRAIQKTIEQLTAVSTILGEDIPSVSRSASQAIKTGMAADLTGALDLMVKSQQNGLNVSGDLLDTLNEYSTQFRKLGLEGPEAMALISQAVKGGARDTDIAADALKEFSIRVVDNSETTRDAFTSMGFDADVMAQKFAAGGQSAHDALGQVLTALRSIKDPVEQARVGVALFGTQYEDLGAAANKFDLSTAVNEFGRVEQASQQAADTMSSNSANEWAEAKNRLVAYAAEVSEAWNVANWGDTIPKAINDWLAPDPTWTPGAPGVPFTPGQSNPPGASTPGRNPLDVFAPTVGGRAAGSNGLFGPAGSSPTQPYGLPVGSSISYGSGGFPPWVYEVGERFGVKASTYAGHQEGSGLNKGIDWSGPPENMRRFAEYLATVPGMEQVIFNDPRDGTKVGVASGQRVGPGTSQPGYYANDWGGHTDHVHTRQSMPIPLPRSTYDSGGWLMPGQTLASNNTGKPELILTPEQVQQMAAQGVDPTTLLHGTGGGAKPGPIPPAGTGAAPGPRTEGYIPAAAGNTAPVGQGGISNFLDLGESFFHNLIDTGAQAASMAVSAAAAAGSFGAGAAAGPAASTAISMGAEAGKRLVSYGYDLGGIWSEALVEQLTPFGAPRWLGSANPTAFMPQWQQGEDQQTGQTGAAQAAIQSWAQPGNPAMASGTALQGAQAALAADPGTGTTTPPAVPSPVDPSTWLPFSGIFDNGGMLEPKSFGINLSRQPEYVFTKRQMQQMGETANAGSSKPGGNGDTIQFYSQNLDEMFRRYRQEQRRSARTHSGRP